MDDVKADYETQMVAVKGRGAAAEPTKLVERIYRKCGKKAELIITPRPSPSPPVLLLPPPPMASRAAPEKNKENNKNKDEEPQVVVAVLNIRMHCEACAQEIKNKILRVKGVLVLYIYSILHLTHVWIRDILKLIFECENWSRSA